MSRKTDQAKKTYCALFETALLKDYPQFAGKIEWDSVIHFFYISKPVDEAVQTYAQNRS